MTVKTDKPLEATFWGFHGSTVLVVPAGAVRHIMPIQLSARYVAAPDSVPSTLDILQRPFRRVGRSKWFVEEGVATYNGDTGVIMECPCASCAEGWTSPGEQLTNIRAPIEHDRP